MHGETPYTNASDIGLRQLLVGMGIGLVSGGVLWLLLALTNQLDVLAHTNTSALGIVLVSLVLGASYAWLFPYGGEHNQSVDEVAATARGLLLGLFIWLVVKLNLQPMLVGQPPLWQAEAVLAALPGLLLCLFLGGFFGLLYLPVFRGLAGPMRMIRQAGAPPPIQTRIVVLGGGYAGVSAAETLEREFAHDLSVAIWLVSETNFLLHTPMLSEVAASAVNAQHISPPLRNTFQHVQVVRAAVERADMGERVVYLAADERTPGRQLAFDHLVVALGAEPNFFGNAGIEANSFTFKSLDDAVRLRNHLIDLFERADQEADVAVRQAMLTFVVAGGGFAGVELMGSLNDFARGITPHYPNINPGEVRMVLVHSGETILPELSVELGKYAQQKMEERGVEFRLKTRVTGAEPGQVLLGAEAVASQTFVWTAGNRPCPVLQQLGVPLTQRGQVEVTRQLSAPTIPYLWAAGDCAQIPYPHSRTGFAPPTAQHALREGKLIGQNIAASIRKRPLKEFDFKTLGSLSALGHQLAVAELFGYRFSGLLAWMMWRAIYLAKLPTLEKRVRVGLDWLLDLFFPPDIVQTIDFGRENKNK